MLKSFCLFTFLLVTCHVYAQSSNADAVKDIMNRCDALVADDDNDLYGHKVIPFINSELTCSQATIPSPISETQIKEFKEVLKIEDEGARTELSSLLREYTLMESALSLWMLNRRFYNFDESTAVFEICKLKFCTERDTAMLKDLLARSLSFIKAIEPMKKEEVLKLVHTKINPAFKKAQKICKKATDKRANIDYLFAKAFEPEKYSDVERKFTISKLSPESKEKVLLEDRELAGLAAGGGKKLFSITEYNQELIQLMNKAVEENDPKVLNSELFDNARGGEGWRATRDNLGQLFIDREYREFVKVYTDILASPIGGIFIIDGLKDKIPDLRDGETKRDCSFGAAADFYAQLKGPEIFESLGGLKKNIESQVISVLDQDQSEKKFIEKSLLGNPMMASELLKTVPDEKIARQVCREIRRINKRDYITDKSLEYGAVTISLVGAILSVPSFGTSVLAADTFIAGTILYGVTLARQNQQLIEEKERLLNNGSVKVSLQRNSANDLLDLIGKLDDVEYDLNQNKKYKDLYILTNGIDAISGGWTQLYKVSQSRGWIPKAMTAVSQEKRVEDFARNTKYAVWLVNKILDEDASVGDKALSVFISHNYGKKTIKNIKFGDAYTVISEIVSLGDELTKLKDKTPYLSDDELYKVFKEQVLNFYETSSAKNNDPLEVALEKSKKGYTNSKNNRIKDAREQTSRDVKYRRKVNRRAQRTLQKTID